MQIFKCKKSIDANSNSTDNSIKNVFLKLLLLEFGDVSPPRKWRECSSNDPPFKLDFPLHSKAKNFVSFPPVELEGYAQYSSTRSKFVQTSMDFHENLSKEGRSMMLKIIEKRISFSSVLPNTNIKDVLQTNIKDIFHTNIKDVFRTNTEEVHISAIQRQKIEKNVICPHVNVPLTDGPEN